MQLTAVGPGGGPARALVQPVAPVERDVHVLEPQVRLVHVQHDAVPRAAAVGLRVVGVAVALDLEVAEDGVVSGENDEGRQLCL